jgi:Ni,Fe-hydrogenase III small subunit
MAQIIGDKNQNTIKQPKIDISSSTPMVCSECGYDVFINGTKMRKLSRLVTGTPQDMVIPFDVLLCGNCGEVNQELLPAEVRALEHKDKLHSEEPKEGNNGSEIII